MVTQLALKSDTRKRKQLLTGLHFSHPAKMHIGLEEWILQEYTKEGDLVLDPMAGSGTVLIGVLMGRNVICVELEEKFCQMERDNLGKLNGMSLYLGTGKRGWAEIIQGDAREMGNIFVDSCVFSPPYAEGAGHGGQETKCAREHNQTSAGRSGKLYGNGNGQIGNLPYGTIDSVITSPPYAAEPTASKKYLKIRTETGRDITKPSSQYAKYGQVDSVITSPPYKNQGQGQGKEYHPERMVGSETGLGRGYSESAGNIGNLKGDNYLQAMYLVYCQCYKVLKPNGLMILVTKNFIRDKKQVDLAGDTMKLCEQAGFTFKERHYRKLMAQSFWRTIYHQKYPEVKPIDFEDVLVFVKGG